MFSVQSCYLNVNFEPLELLNRSLVSWINLVCITAGATDAEENGRSMESSSLNGFTNGLQDHTDNDCNDRDTQYQKNNDNAKSSNTSDSILVITDCTDGDYGSFSSDKIVDKEDDLARISSSKLSGSKTNDEKEFEASNCIDDETYHKSVYTNSKTDYRTTDGSNSCSDGITYTQSESGTINLANTCQSTTARTDNGLYSMYDNSGKQNEVKLPSRELHRFSDDSSDPTNCGSIHLKDISSEESTASDKSSFKNKALDQASKDFELRYDAKVHDCRPGSTGLANNVNMCYINSIVQCLSAVKELRTYLLCEYNLCRTIR